MDVKEFASHVGANLTSDTIWKTFWGGCKKIFSNADNLNEMKAFAVGPREDDLYHKTYSSLTQPYRDRLDIFAIDMKNAGCEVEYSKVMSQWLEKFNNIENPKKAIADQQSALGEFARLPHDLSGFDLRERNVHCRRSTGSKKLEWLDPLRNDNVVQFFRKWVVGEGGDIITGIMNSLPGRIYLSLLAVAATLVGIMTGVEVVRALGIGHWGIIIVATVLLVLTWNEYGNGRNHEWPCWAYIIGFILITVIGLLTIMIPNPLISSLIWVGGYFFLVFLLAPVGKILNKKYGQQAIDIAVYYLSLTLTYVLLWRGASLEWIVISVVSVLILFFTSEVKIIKTALFKTAITIVLLVSIIAILSPFFYEGGKAQLAKTGSKAGCWWPVMKNDPRCVEVVQASAQAATGIENRRSVGGTGNSRVIQLLGPGIDSEAIPRQPTGTKLNYSSTVPGTEVCFWYHGIGVPECVGIDAQHGVKHVERRTFRGDTSGAVHITLTPPKEMG